ncbi:MAG: Radical SAM domain protein [Candidatus Woesebacteria bacterium GW2011_GWA1_39_8]|uniref:Radical SAM domain protein n=1 Tax=Candidatus Woesebacteria bacterium GW2011_GWA1_39_8 TaxID=1618552 RepID=A0A0G0PQM4_9BACT|nr:MAG: Radical SAM domain protein [Candidatus Woesebacteria bacterium GW2011_GWA1_39_8]
MRKITRKSLIHKSKVEYADHGINHVEGCSHGCKFPCYAMMMKIRFGVIKDYQDWRRPKIVSNALELLDKEIPRYKDKIKTVHLCFTTDPFMYMHKRVSNLSLKIIERLNKDNIRCTVLTKGIYPKILADKKTYGRNNEYGITLVSLSRKFKMMFEPYAAPYNGRVESLKVLHNNGLKTWVSMEPYPTPNLVKQDLEEILKKISFVDKIIFGRWHYNKKSTQFKNNTGFYNDCAETVIQFCKKNKIEYYIKRKTQTNIIKGSCF